MYIGSHLDKSQFEVNGEFTAESRRRFQEYTDTYFRAQQELKPAIFTAVCSLKGRINERLQEHRQFAYNAIVGMVSAEDYDQIAQYDYELLCFHTATKIYLLERGNTTSLFDYIDDVDGFQEIYQQIIFYYRRIQLRWAKPLQTECLTYARQKNLSVYALTQILLDCRLGGKEQIAMSLSDMYAEQGFYNEALFILTVMAEQACEERRQELEEKKNRLLEEHFNN
ncbi:MAG: hypothetical protein ACI4DU_06415 [Lachnospiraceae bacterium]